ncbi:hypothetical protein EZS27_033624, partial [termite gut metagenome]
MLLGGDISGIQKFIYNIASRKAAVSLKGRSFYLQLLIDSVIQRIISHPDINVNIGNVVYSSGGKFYMLLPNTQKIQNAITILKEEFERELWNEHKGQLLLNLEHVPFAYSVKSKDIYCENQEGKTIGDLWKCLADKLTASKNTKFKSILIESYNKLFLPQPCGEKVKVCSVTGVESEKCVKLDSDDESPNVLPIVRKQAELGNILKDVDYILTNNQPHGTNVFFSDKYKFNISIVGVNNYLFDQKEFKQWITELTSDKADFRKITSSDTYRVKRVNDTSFLEKQLKGQAASYGFQFYGGNEQAEENNKIKTFDKLAGDTSLGILRMDVDNLGMIFINGLSDEDKSFAAYSTLSFLLDYFFSGYLNMIRNQPEFKDDVNILYSGGDDVFAVGRWDKLVLFAEQIRNDFREFVGRNDISISGGITIVGEKYPIAKAAELAGDAEKNAKNYNDKKKNALNMFGENISWDKEFDLVKDWKTQFIVCIEHGMPRSILHKIMEFASMKKRGNISFAWNTIYYLTRFEEGKKDIIKDFCQQLQKKFFFLSL